MSGGKPKRTMTFQIDDMVLFKYMTEHEIKYLKDLFDQAGISYTHYHQCQAKGYLTLETAWKLAEYLGVMIEDVIIAEKIKEEKQYG